MQSSWWWIVLGAAVFFLLVWFVHKQTQQKKLNKNFLETSELDERQILVLLPVYRAKAEALQTLQSLDRNAHFPRRVVVAILTCHCDLTPRTQRITVRCRSQTTAALGPHLARVELMQRLWYGEEFLLSTKAGVQFLPGWDSLLLDSLDAAHDAGAHAVTQFPARVAELWSGAPPTFPLQVQPKRFRPRFMLTPRPRPWTSLAASYSCLFLPAAVKLWDNPGIPFLEGPEADWVLSTELYLRGIRTMTTRESIVFCPPTIKLPSSKKDNQKGFRSARRARRHILQTLAGAEDPKEPDEEPSEPLQHEWLTSLGPQLVLAPSFSQLFDHPNASLGLPANPPAQEVIQKYGSYRQAQALIGEGQWE